MTTSVIQQNRLSKDEFDHRSRKGIPLYHRSGKKPLDPTPLPRCDVAPNTWWTLKGGANKKKKERVAVKWLDLNH